MIISEPVQTDVFIPFSITLTFENQEEVNDLYNRVNLSRHDVKECSGIHYKTCGQRFNLSMSSNTQLLDEMIANKKIYDVLKRFV